MPSEKPWHVEAAEWTSREGGYTGSDAYELDRLLRAALAEREELQDWLRSSEKVNTEIRGVRGRRLPDRRALVRQRSARVPAMSTFDERLRDLWVNHYHGGGHSPGELETLVRAAAAIGADELHAVALKFTADLVRMGLEDLCPGRREHLDREQVVERAMRFKRDIDAIRATASKAGKL